MGPSEGRTATLSFSVTEDDTAVAVGSGHVPVLGTPRLIAWCEAATMAAIAPALGEQQTSVGSRIMVDHLAPTPVGATVEVTATVEAVEGRQVTFVVSAREAPGSGPGADAPVAAGGGPIMTGTVVRVVVDRERFIARLGR